MNEFEMRVRIQGAFHEIVEKFMVQNNLSATVMEDAMNATMVWLKDLSMKELVLAMNAQPETPSQEEEEDQNGDIQ